MSYFILNFSKYLIRSFNTWHAKLSLSKRILLQTTFMKDFMLCFWDTVPLNQKASNDAFSFERNFSRLVMIFIYSHFSLGAGEMNWLAEFLPQLFSSAWLWTQKTYIYTLSHARVHKALPFAQPESQSTALRVLWRRRLPPDPPLLKATRRQRLHLYPSELGCYLGTSFCL